MAAAPPERATMRTTFMRVLNTHGSFTLLPLQDRDTIVRRIERSCFNTSITKAETAGVVTTFTGKKFIELYSAECSRILHNISSNTAFNSYLIDKIITFEVDLNTIADLKSEDLNPEVSAAEREEIRIRMCQKTERKVSYKYKCKKCGGNETIPLEYQGLAVDEASSHSIKCINCENVWRS